MVSVYQSDVVVSISDIVVSILDDENRELRVKQGRFVVSCCFATLPQILTVAYGILITASAILSTKSEILTFGNTMH